MPQSPAQVLQKAVDASQSTKAALQAESAALAEQRSKAQAAAAAITNLQQQRGT